MANLNSFHTLSNVGVGVTGSDVFIVKYDTSGNYQWATQMGGTSSDQGNGISTDSLGNVYVTGFFYSASLNIYDASAHKYGVANDLSLSNVGITGTQDVFIVKYDTSGNYCWATQIGGTGYDAGNDISTDSLGNVYVTGYFYNASLKIYDASAHKYNGGDSDLSLSLVGGAETQDTFIVKYDTSGVYQWATQMGGTTYDYGVGISTDSLGNVYVTGFFNDTILNIYDASAHKYNGGDSDLSLSLVGRYQNTFIVKYDTSGNYCWATQMGGYVGDRGTGISTDLSGNVYVTGSFSDTSLNIYDAIQIVNNIPVYVPPIGNICFPAGTPITVDQGVVSIENINPAIHTIKGKRINGVSKTTSTSSYLVCLEKDALGKNSPTKRTLISPLHKIMHNNKWVMAKDLFGLNIYNVTRVAYNGEPLYNVIMQTHESMLVNNLIAETLHPSNPIAKSFIKNV